MHNRTGKLKIAIMGTPVAPGNRGVMALGASLVDLLLAAAPGAEICFLQLHSPWPDVSVLSRQGRYSVPVVTCRLSPRAKFTDHLLGILLLGLVYRCCRPARNLIQKRCRWIRTVVEADFVGDIRGGDSFSDIYGLKRFAIASLTVWTVILLKGRIVHFPQTYGPFKSGAARWIARRLLRRSSSLTARDTTSQSIAQALAPKLRVGCSPDVAFALPPEPLASIAFDEAPNTDASHVIGLNVNGLMYNGGYTRNDMFALKLDYAAFLTELATSLLEGNTAELWLIPHTYAVFGDVESDNEASAKLKASLPPALAARVRQVVGDYDQHGLKHIIGRCDFFVGSRMHACIAALSQGVPCVGVAYSMKFAGVFASVGMGDWVIDGRSVSAEEAAAGVLARYRQRDERRSALKRRAQDARATLDAVFAELTAGAISPEKRAALAQPAGVGA